MQESRNSPFTFVLSASFMHRQSIIYSFFLNFDCITFYAFKILTILLLRIYCSNNLGGRKRKKTDRRTPKNLFTGDSRNEEEVKKICKINQAKILKFDILTRVV